MMFITISNLLISNIMTTFPLNRDMWYILNYVPVNSHARANLPALVNRFSASLPDENLELFAPTFYKIETSEKGPRRVERPMFYHYIFLNGSEQAIKKLCATFDGFSFVIDRTGLRRHLVVDDRTMDAIKLMAQLHGNRLECYSPDDIDLQEGDKVEIVTGEFAGLTGTFMPKKGGRTGNIVIAVTQSFGAVIYDIHADSIRVKEFAPSTRRQYDQIDAYIPRLLKILDNPKASPDVMAPAVIFTRRFGKVKIDNPKLEAKLQMLLYASYRLLGLQEEAAKAWARYRQIDSNITNVWTRALCHLVLGRLNADSSEFEKGRELISSYASRLSPLQQTIATKLDESTSR